MGLIDIPFDPFGKFYNGVTLLGIRNPYFLSRCF